MAPDVRNVDIYACNNGTESHQVISIQIFRLFYLSRYAEKFMASLANVPAVHKNDGHETTCRQIPILLETEQSRALCYRRLDLLA